MGVKALALNVLARARGVPSGFPRGAGSGTLIRPKKVTESDPYAERMEKAWQRVCQPDYPGGMIPWLREAHPGLYSELTSQIPDEISRLWNDRAALGDFEAILNRLVSAHQQGCKLYLEARTKKNGVFRAR